MYRHKFSLKNDPACRI